MGGATAELDSWCVCGQCGAEPQAVKFVLPCCRFPCGWNGPMRHDFGTCEASRIMEDEATWVCF